MHQPLTFDTMGGEECLEKHSILDSRWSFITVLPVDFVIPFFDISCTLPQPSGDEVVKLVLEGMATLGWVPKNLWIKEDWALEEVVVGFGWSEVETCFELNPSFEEKFNSSKFLVYHTS